MPYTDQITNIVRKSCFRIRIMDTNVMQKPLHSLYVQEVMSIFNVSNCYIKMDKLLGHHPVAILETSKVPDRKCD